jgi:phosphoribosylformylglycinamidine synthase
MGLSPIRSHGAHQHGGLPGADAAVVRIKERVAPGISLDGNGRYCAANPREGAKLMVAEAARNVVCVGAQPIAITIA